MPPLASDESWIDKIQMFEPIGRNCEFGFVLRDFGSRRSSLFRWTFVEPKSLLRLLNGRFSGFFDRENLRPEMPGAAGNTVRETKFNCILHSAIALNGVAKFDFDEPRLKMLYRIEKAKIDKQIADFTLRLEAGATICVLSVMQHEVKMAEDVLGAIDSYAGNAKNSLLIVSERATESVEPGTIEVLGPRILHGRLSRLAPGEAAYIVEFGEWRAIIEHTIHMLVNQRD